MLQRSEPSQLRNEPSHGVRAARAAAVLACEAGALGLAVVTLRLGPAAPAFLQSNALAPSLRLPLALAIVVSALLPVLFVVGVWRRPGWLERCEQAARRAAPLVPLGALPALCSRAAWVARPLDYLLMLAGFVLLLERCARIAFDAGGFVPEPLVRAAARLRPGARAALGLVVLASAAYALDTGYLTVLKHYRFGTGAYDLAIFDNMMWNGLHGEPFRSTVMFGNRGGNAIADHAHYAEVLFLPLYALWPRAETLLWLQAVVLGFAAVPLYLFAATQLPRAIALLLALAYLVYAPLHGAQFYDFHWLPLAIFFHFWLYYALATDRRWLAIASVLVLFLLREDVAPGVAVVGALLLFSGAKPRAGAWLMLSGVLWTLVNKFVLMPLAGPWWFAEMYKGLSPTGAPGWAGIATTLVGNPLYALTTLLTARKLEYTLHLLVPIAFLPLRRAWLLPLLLPGVVFTVLTTWDAAFSIWYQYTSHWIPYVFGASVLALAAIGERSGNARRAACLALCAGVFAHSAVFGALLEPSGFLGGGGVRPSYTMTSSEAKRYRELQRLIAMIPPGASVTSTDIEAPHVSNRRDIFAVAQDVSKGDYLLVNVESLDLARTRVNLSLVLSDPAYGLLADGNDGKLFLFKRGQVSPRTAEAKRRILIAKRHVPGMP